MTADEIARLIIGRTATAAAQDVADRHHAEIARWRASLGTEVAKTVQLESEVERLKADCDLWKDRAQRAEARRGAHAGTRRGRGV